MTAKQKALTLFIILVVFCTLFIFNQIGEVNANPTHLEPYRAYPAPNTSTPAQTSTITRTPIIASTVVPTIRIGRNNQIFLPDILSDASFHPIIPPVTRSYYVRYLYFLDQPYFMNSLYWMGYQQGQEDYQRGGSNDSIVFLHFYQPDFVFNTNLPGAYLGDSTEIPLHDSNSVIDIERLAISFAKGYYLGTWSNNQSRVKIVLSINNNNSISFSQAHGAAWGAEVLKLKNLFQDQNLCNNNGYNYYFCEMGNFVDFAGGGDFEVEASSYSKTKLWLDGYNSSAGGTLFYNFGDASGCPPVPGGTCNPINTDWSQQNIVNISSCLNCAVMPEIYVAGMENQWHELSVLNYNNTGNGLTIVGVFSDHYADNSHYPANDAFSNLYNVFAQDNRLAQKTFLSLKRLTDICWMGGTWWAEQKKTDFCK